MAKMANFYSENKCSKMATRNTGTAPDHDEVVGVEIVHGTEECRRRSLELLEELGFPKQVLPLKDLEECGRVHSTGFVWMKQKTATEHYFKKAKALVRYAEEVTGYLEKGRMKRVVGVKSKQAMLWVTVTEMSIREDPLMPKICFTTLFGVQKTFPITAFTTDEEPVMTSSRWSIVCNASSGGDLDPAKLENKMEQQ